MSVRCALHVGGQTDENRSLTTKVRTLEALGEPEGAVMGRVLGEALGGAGSIQTGLGGGHQVVVLNFTDLDYFFYMLTTVHNYSILGGGVDSFRE